MVLQTLKQCNNLKIQKSYTSSQFDEQEDQRWVTKPWNVGSGFVVAACSGFPGEQFDDAHENQHSVGSMHAWAKGTCLRDQAPSIKVYRNAIKRFKKKKKQNTSLTSEAGNALATNDMIYIHKKAQKIYKQWELLDKTRKSMRGNCPNNQSYTEKFSML